LGVVAVLKPGTENSSGRAVWC